MKIISISQKADLGLGFIFAGVAIYSLINQSYLLAGVWVISSVVSFASAKYSPARWLAKRMLMARLKV